MKNPASELAKKRWGKVKKENRSKILKKVRKGFDPSNIKLRYKPQDLKREILEEISNGTDKGHDYAVLLALSDKKARTEREIKEMVTQIEITAACELNRRDGNFEISKNFDWFTNWSAKLTEKGKSAAIKVIKS